MFIRVSGAQFRNVLERMLSTRTDNINFYKEGNRLYMHTYGNIIYNVYIDILESDTDEFEVTAIIEKLVGLLSDEPVTITKTEELLIITQSNFEYSATVGYETRIQSNAYTCECSEPFPKGVVSSLVLDCKTLDGLARDLGMHYAPINIHNGQAYVLYSNTGLVEDVGLKDMCIGSDVLAKVLSIIGKREATYYVDYQRSVMYVKCSESEVIVVNITDVNKRTVETALNYVNAVMEVTDVDMTKYNDVFTLISQLYTKTLLDLSVCDKELAVYIGSATKQFRTGFNSLPLFTLKMSTSQLSALCKMFGKFNNVSVKRGDNKVCLEQKTLRKQLLISGLLY